MHVSLCLNFIRLFERRSELNSRLLRRLRVERSRLHRRTNYSTSNVLYFCQSAFLLEFNGLRGKAERLGRKKETPKTVCTTRRLEELVFELLRRTSIPSSTHRCTSRARRQSGSVAFAEECDIQRRVRVRLRADSSQSSDSGHSSGWQPRELSTSTNDITGNVRAGDTGIS